VVSVYAASQSLASDTMVNAPVFGASTSATVHIVPLQASVAYERFGMSVNRPHVMFANSGTESLWARGNRVMIKNTGLTEVVTITVTNSTGGTFTLTHENQTTAAIAYNASAATVQAALVAISSIGAAGVVCTGGALMSAPVVCTFSGTAHALKNMWDLTATSSLTHATLTPSVTVTTNQRDRMFTVVTPPMVYNSGGSANHLQVLLEELELAS
jgi:hypothetical protein